MVSRSGLQAQPAAIRHPTTGPVDAAPRQHAIESAAQADRQVAQARQAVQQAASQTAVRSALQDAEKALNAARRAGGDRAAKAALRGLEHKVEQLRREAKKKQDDILGREHSERVVADSYDNLSRMSLGVVRQDLAEGRPGNVVVERRDDVANAAPGPMARELAQLRESGHVAKQQVGDFSEAAAAGFVGVLLGHGLLQQHNPGDRPQGLDLQSISSDGTVYTFEVKGTATRVADQRDVKPRTSTGTTPRQGSAQWIRTRSEASPVVVESAVAVGDSADQIASRIVKVNLADGEILVYRLDSAGRTASDPDFMASLDDVVAAIDEDVARE